ncbi:MAG: sodium:proton antiporter [Candidatus Dadabacteria bacterium]|nr:sodium:proton antiporter [Candidatus Dadabacteria bacterium]
MDIFDIAAVVITIAALFSFLNYRYIKLPTAIGVMLISLVLSLVLIILGAAGISAVREQAEALVGGIDFSRALMHGMLSFLLFAGSLHVNVNDLLEKKWEIGTFATLGVLLSTLIVGGVSYALSLWLGLGLPFIYCLLFGALISPTDPIAVLSILKRYNAPKSLETKITGESLFNDGIGVVVFITILAVALSGGNEVHPGEVGLLFAEEIFGGAALGLALGWLTYLMIKSVDNYQVEVLLTLGLVTGGYALALSLHVSGPIAIVFAGLLIGNHGRQFGMSEETRKNLDTFWELIDEVLNAVLFVLIGFEILLVTLSRTFLAAGLLSIPIVLLARFAVIGIPIWLFKFLRRTFSPNAIKILTWGGLRGGISVALALSLPTGPERDVILTMTYSVVVFSILVQGLTVKYLIAGAGE